jgi:hypothetical protein
MKTGNVYIYQTSSLILFPSFPSIYSLFFFFISNKHKKIAGDRQNDLKDERRRAQMSAARLVLERSTMMLLTSSKVYSLFNVMNRIEIYARYYSLSFLPCHRRQL